MILQEMQSDLQSHEALLQGVVSLGACLYPTAPEGRVRELTDDITQLEERSTSMKNSITQR